MTARDQVRRMLALVPYLQARDGIAVGDVAADFGVTPDQVRSDVRQLMFVGPGHLPGELIDIEMDALEGEGRIRIRDADFWTRPLRLDQREALAIIVALRTLRASAAEPEMPVIDSALAKLEGVVGSVEAPVAVHVDDVDTSVRYTVTDAARAGRRLELTYLNPSRDDRTVRQVDPRRVFTAHGRWYLEAWCLRAEDLRFFRLDRVASVADTGVAAAEHPVAGRELDPGLFDVDASTPAAVFEVEATALWVAEAYRGEVLDSDDRRARVRIHARDEEWLRRLALRHGEVARVVEPERLRAAVTDAAALSLVAYDEDE